MSRSLSGRIHVTGELTALDPLHVGSGGESVETDLALAVDGQGRLYTPGTGLAGALRHWCEQRFGTRATNAVWGWQAETESRISPDHASFLFVEDSLLQDPDNHPSEVRDHVGIDRQWGSAAAGIKFDRAVLPRGAKFDFTLTLDLPQDTAEAARARAMLGHLLRALQAAEIRLGAAKTRGLGRVQLSGELSIAEQRWNRGGLIGWLKGDLPRVSIQQLTAADPTFQPGNRPRLEIEIRWQPEGPVMVKSGADGITADSVPLLGGCRGGLAPLIPGSSFKGALRSQAERILRTVLQLQQPAWTSRNSPGRVRFLDQLDEGYEVQHAGMELIQYLFGARSRRGGKIAQASLSVADCFSRMPSAAENWDALYFDTNAPDGAEKDAAQKQARFRQAQARTLRKGWQQAFHVAIDRWTGGAAENLLYQVLEPFSEPWESFRLELDLGRLSPSGQENASCQSAAWVLLLLTLRELASDRIPIGFGVNRGLGAVAIDEIRLRPTGGGCFGLEDEVILAQGRLDNLDPKLRAAWTRQWQEFVIKRATVKTGEPADE